MPQLPIDTIIPKLQQIFASDRNVVLSALPGAGKTTRIPLTLLDEPWMHGQRMIMLEPRRLAARSASTYMASRLDEQVGQTVGYRTRLDTRISRDTRLEVVTEGILTRLLQTDPSLRPYNLVIFDEFHERSLHADLGLALCLQTQEVLREDLRILVMSATLDSESVSNILNNAPIITCEGKVFPVETHYVPQIRNSRIESAIVNCIKLALNHETGNLLVFLPGAGEIRRVQHMLHSAHLGPQVIIAPLFGNLPQQEQDQAIQSTPAGIRKIVLSTSIAETSLTIEGIRVVIDSGLMRIPRFDPQSGMTRLVTIPVSQDSSEQRRGRAGRLEPGACYRLWSANEQLRLRQQTIPEILGADLSAFALELAAWGIVDPHTLTWLDPPPAGAFAQAQHLLTQLGAIDDQHRITPHGKIMAEIPLHPRLAHMILRSREFEMETLAIEIATILNERDILKSHPSERTSDLRVRIDLLQSSLTNRQSGKGEGAGLTRIMKSLNQLQNQLQIPNKNRKIRSQTNSVGLLLALAYPDRIAQRQSRQADHYRLSNGKSAIFLQTESLSTEKYLVIAELDGTKPHARILLAAPVKLEELEEQCSELFYEIEFVKWDEQNLVVQARKQRRLGELVIEDYPSHDLSSPLITTTLLQGIRQQGLNCLPWTKDLRNWQARVNYIRKISGEESDWPDVSDNYLLETLESWLEPYLNGMSRLAEVKRINLNVPLHALLNWKQQQALEQQAPSHMIVPTGSRIALDYCSQDIPILAVRLQEMFGQHDTPKLADGNGKVLLHLLSPARRPIQVTQDLASFWKNGYQEVKKELQGRYPKHHWPDDPLQAQPTRRTIPRP
ncbi:ATP-dependent helicase HrpB [Candidatus Nitrospira salsa]